jgi:hypothetical protein
MKDYHPVMNPYVQLDGYMSRLLDRYLNARAALVTYEALRKLRSPNHAGKKKVQDNVRILGRYNYFFSATEVAHQVVMLLELSKLFDSNPRALSLQNFVKLAGANLAQLTASNFFAYRESKGEPVSDDFFRQLYKPLSRRDLADMKRSFESLKALMPKLKIYRDQWLAHDDMEKSDAPVITGLEVHRAFKVAEKIFDKLSSRIQWTSTVREHYFESTELDTKRAIADLVKLETLTHRGGR